MAHLTQDKNFRLPTTVRPRRYDATLTLDLQNRSFTGVQALDLTLAAPTQELILHAIALSLSSVRFRKDGRTLTPTSIEPVTESETVLLRFGEPLPAGDATLDVEWSGRFSEGLRGLYMAGQVAATQFETADARRLFPCFDEPAFKARWALTVRVPKGVTALGNGRIISDEADGDLRKVTFAETELLSSYLIALVVGNLAGTDEEKVDGVPVRTWALPEKKHLTRFGQDIALAVLPRLSGYFGLPYAFGKVDQVGIPDFEAGAMENAGLITYREVALLLDPATAPLSVQKRVAEGVTHELAHQWFGNWVTMVWWDDLWLNEAFATWMAYKIVDGIKPDWRVWMDFDIGKAAALHLDSLKSTHPVRGEVRNAQEASESFDLITYEKGGAVLRMLEGFLGEEGFREGIRQYMRKHARANAVADDLWGALGNASAQPVVEVANAWIRQSGFPMVTATLNGHVLSLSQQRFYSAPGNQSDEKWPVPVVLRFADQRGVREQRVLLREARAEVKLEAQGEVRWLTANAGNTGFYRVAYDDAGLARLSAHVKELEPAERIALLADQWALVRSQRMAVGPFLDLISRFGDETDDAVLDEVVGRLSYLESRLVSGDDEVRFRDFVRQLLEHQLSEVGWEAKPGESDRTRLRRAAIIRAVGSVARSHTAIQEARQRVTELLRGTHSALEPNLHDTAVGMVARAGDHGLFEEFLRKFPSEPDPATKRRYLLALTAFEDPALAQRAQDLLFTEAVPMQDVASFVLGLLTNRTGREAFWGTMRKRWKDVTTRTGGAPMLMRRVVESLGQLYERRHLEELRVHLDAHPIPEAQQAVAQTVERLTQDVSLRERLMPEVAAWLRNRSR